MADLLGVDPGRLGASRIRIFGESLPVIGLIDAGAFNGLKDLDGEPLSPADFKLTDEEAIAQMTTQETREKQGLEQPEVEIMPFEHINPDDILIVPYKFLRQVGSPLQSVALRFDARSNVAAYVKELLSRLSVVLFAGLPDADGRINVSVFSSLGDTSRSAG